jgi:hypothetical protein
MGASMGLLPYGILNALATMTRRRGETEMVGPWQRRGGPTTITPSMNSPDR